MCIIDEHTSNSLQSSHLTLIVSLAASLSMCITGMFVMVNVIIKNDELLLVVVVIAAAILVAIKWRKRCTKRFTLRYVNLWIILWYLSINRALKLSL